MVSVQELNPFYCPLDPKMWQKYQALGINVIPSWHLCPDVVCNADPGNLKIDHEQTKDIAIVPPSDPRFDLEKLVKYDKAVTMLDSRATWLKHWINHPDGHGRIALDRDSSVVGYGVIRGRDRGELTVGPLQADNEQIARWILEVLLKEFPDIHNRKVELIYLSDDDRMKTIVRELSTEIQSGTSIRMYSREEPKFEKQRLFCISDHVNIF